MANEIAVTGSLGANKPTAFSSAIGRSYTGLLFNMTGNPYSEGVILVAVSPGTAIPLGQVTAPHWAFFINKDITNYVTIRNGQTGQDLLRLYPGEPAGPVPLDNGSTPWAVANTAALLLEFLILQF